LGRFRAKGTKVKSYPNNETIDFLVLGLSLYFLIQCNTPKIPLFA
jgi:hypothetical protein